MNFKRKRRRRQKAQYWRAKQLYATADRMKARRSWLRDERTSGTG